MLEARSNEARGIKDTSVRRAARQEAGLPNPAPPSATNPIIPGNGGPQTRPVMPRDTRLNEDQMSEETRRAIERIIPGGPAASGTLNAEQAAELSSVLIPRMPKFNIAAAAGLPRNANPYVVTLQQAFTLALINARIYQLQLENLYTSALTVALDRFQFAPQFYAGMSPPGSDAPLGAGFPGVNPANQFIYSTRSSPAGQVSTLTMGDVAGMGKLLNTGGQLLAGFANQVVFNFVGKNPIQPTVHRRCR